MALVETDLDKVQARLHDGGTLWSRAELLRYYNDGYVELLARSECTKRLLVLDIPGRVSRAGTYEWEDRFTRGTYHKFTHTSEREGWFTTYAWEVEHLRGVAPTDSITNVTQLWERVYAGGDIDQRFRFFLAAHSHAIVRVAHDKERLSNISVKYLDLKDSKWYNEGGEPRFYTPGVGRDLSFEVYQVVTEYQSTYESVGDTTGGIRKLSGSRTYETTVDKEHQNDSAYTTRGDAEALENAGNTPLFGSGNANLRGMGYRFTFAAADIANGFCTNLWEKELLDGSTPTTTGKVRATHYWEAEFATALDIPLGGLRAGSSPDRQYAPQAYNPGDIQNVGVARDLKSATDSVSVLEAITAPRDLVESDSPSLLPRQLIRNPC